MKKIPISICLFTSTKGHFGHHTYLDTINYLNNHIPLSNFGCLFSHIKVSPDNDKVGNEIESNLKLHGFTVDKTVGDWSRGTSHQQHYLSDMAKVSRNQMVHSQPYMLLLEDDSPLICHKTDLISCLFRMIRFLEDNLDIVSTRFIRAGDFSNTPVVQIEQDYFYSPHFNFQPAILRTRDFFLANKIIQNNWDNVKHLQCELTMRLALNQLSFSNRNHVVWLPEYGETYHLGSPDYEKIKREIGL